MKFKKSFFAGILSIFVGCIPVMSSAKVFNLEDLYKFYQKSEETIMRKNRKPCDFRSTKAWGLWSMRAEKYLEVAQEMEQDIFSDPERFKVPEIYSDPCRVVRSEDYDNLEELWAAKRDALEKARVYFLEFEAYKEVTANRILREITDDIATQDADFAVQPWELDVIRGSSNYRELYENIYSIYILNQRLSRFAGLRSEGVRCLWDDLVAGKC